MSFSVTPRRSGRRCWPTSSSDFTALLQLLLEAEGYAVALAGNGAEALRRVAEHPPALILLDLHLPVLSGCEVNAALARQQRRIPVLIMTAATSALQEATRLGAEGCVPKPFDLDVLLRTVAHFAT